LLPTVTVWIAGVLEAPLAELVAAAARLAPNSELNNVLISSRLDFLKIMVWGTGV
jgi:hypothetical protein